MPISITHGKTKKILEDCGVSASTFAKIINAPVSSVTASFRDASCCYFGCVREAELNSVALRLKAIVEALRPLTFDKNDSASLKTLLNGGREPGEIRDAIKKIFFQTTGGDESSSL